MTAEIASPCFSRKGVAYAVARGTRLTIKLARRRMLEVERGTSGTQTCRRSGASPCSAACQIGSAPVVLVLQSDSDLLAVFALFVSILSDLKLLANVFSTSHKEARATMR